MSKSEITVNEFLKHPETKRILRGRIYGGTFADVHSRSAPYLDRLYKHIEGSGMNYGGSIHSGGAVKKYHHIMSEGENIKNHKDAYHFLLNLTPSEFECLREIASQLMGGMPSPMWGDLREKGDKLEVPIENYHHFISMPSNHHAAKLIEAEYGVGKGGSFLKTVKHIARKASKLYKIGHQALGVVNRNKDLLLNIPGLDKYKQPISNFLDAASRIDDAVNPIVEATIDATKANATAEDKQKLKNLAEQSIKKVVKENVPQGDEWVKFWEEIRSKNNARQSNIPVQNFPSNSDTNY